MAGVRRGTTGWIVLLGLLVLALGVGVFVLWNRVSKLNAWAVSQEVWMEDELYDWIKNRSFQQGSGSGNPDGDKPPPPPGGLE